MIPNIGPMEIAIVVVVALVIFGPKRIPELGSSLGRGISSFRKGIDGHDEPESAAIVAAAPAPVEASEEVARGA
jgi:TatA/E family protein of Tat protein translocase